jgi:hypothetical protein
MTKSATIVHDCKRRLPAAGMRLVIVKGAPVIRNGEFDQAARPGRWVREPDLRAGEVRLKRRFGLSGAQNMSITWLTLPRRPIAAARAARP